MVNNRLKTLKIVAEIVVAIILLVSLVLGVNLVLKGRNNLGSIAGVVGPKIAFSTTTSTMKLGESKSFDILLSTDTNFITAVQVDLSYDPTVLDQVTFSNGTITPVVLKPLSTNNGIASITLGVMPTKAFHGNGIVGKLNVHAKTIKKTSITFTQNSIVTSMNINSNTLTTSDSILIDIVPNTILDFSDVPTSHWAYSNIRILQILGIVQGCSQNPLKYCPEDPTTRSTASIFLLKGKYGQNYSPPLATKTSFSDVPTSHWAYKWIEQLAKEGITSGCGSGKYCPESPVTRAQMAVYIVKTFNLKI